MAQLGNRILGGGSANVITRSAEVRPPRHHPG
jgi:hypothetical protein